MALRPSLAVAPRHSFVLTLKLAEKGAKEALSAGMKGHGLIIYIYFFFGGVVSFVYNVFFFFWGGEFLLFIMFFFFFGG